ncbi:hypothetical protein EW146_g7177 [Bondarzewia mesenterica]|uniref:Glucosidase II beta subunit N-terminal domain-containing protein n=1 Tax=Bondarzewia mesenterica TaxID=1095465 RepID=A0A4S4LLJ6_9AGAM|nr:hypothetical protein EW146_g7177 [Bondarzewia mesenterica]
MHSWLLPLLASLLPTTALKVPKTHGVPPQFLHCYTSEGSGTWTCLDGSQRIPWTSVDNDYCDCTDRSDEPGTGACPDPQFYRKNEGHISASIPSSRLNDEICLPGQAVEPDCCDGLDEPSGVYENACKEVGEDYRVDAERNLRKTVKFQASKTNKIGRSTFNYHDTSRLPQTPLNPPLHSIIHRLSSTVSNSRHART